MKLSEIAFTVIMDLLDKERTDIENSKSSLKKSTYDKLLKTLDEVEEEVSAIGTY